ncbi:helix-turn-helix domain-containing protein [Microbacterium sp. E-13]|uniref:helix-turn-helix domain-containing protein n=1 Tax=Microbacterium sp. E-13 TaxID=3404048 RepID=UPI003CF88E9A
MKLSPGILTSPIRPPQQARSRAAWERILDVGLRLPQQGGFDAVTIGDVCRQADVSAPSIYARVDGRAGLLLAVGERGMALVHTQKTRRSRT